jgi:hypothetical protein
MKNARLERLGRMQRQYHRHHQWKLSRGGLFIPHSYAETKPDSLSWWDDVGFIVNSPRPKGWGLHPGSTAVPHISKDVQLWLRRLMLQGRLTIAPSSPSLAGQGAFAC